MAATGDSGERDRMGGNLFLNSSVRRLLMSGSPPQGVVKRAPEVFPQVPAGEGHLNKVGVREARRQGGEQRGESPHHGGVRRVAGPTSQADAGGWRRSTRVDGGLVVFLVAA